VGHDRQRLAVIDREEQNQSDVALVGCRGDLHPARRLAVLGQVMMSELMRTAPTPSFGQTPSMLFKLYRASLRAVGAKLSERSREIPRPWANSLYASSMTPMQSRIVKTFSTSSLERIRVMRVPVPQA